MPTLKFIFIILEVLLLFNLLIGVHELGHFLAAKWRGLKIDRFAIWFGKPLWKKKINGVEYALGWIPAGGYVALPQMATMEAIEGKSENSDQPLPSISALDKIIVAFAGPLFSFLLAVFFAVVVWQVGRPEQIPSKDSTVIGWVGKTDKEGNPGPAWAAGLRPGDKILKINGYPVTQFAPPSQDSVMWRLITSSGTNIPIEFERDGKISTVYPVPYHRPTKWYERKALRQILIAPAYPASVAEVISNGPAARAGLKPGDEIISVDNEKIYSSEMVLDYEKALTNGPIKPVTLSVKRDDHVFECSLLAERPVKPTNAPPSFGLALWSGSTNETITHPLPGDQIRESAGQIFATISALVHKNEIGVQQLGSALMIVRVYSNLLDSDNGWRRVLWFSVIMNVNLALINMLPFPVLDGGHIMLAILEAIRRRPVSARILQYIQTGCAMLLIGLMLFLFFFDAGDWWRSSRSNHEEPIVFAPKN
jgi:regulator of sigma E protease